MKKLLAVNALRKKQNCDQMAIAPNVLGTMPNGSQTAIDNYLS